jgi:pterin-4a-carbinolamine dehydratase
MSLNQYFKTGNKVKVNLKNLKSINKFINENVEEINPELNLPLEAKESKWQTLYEPERLMRVYSFETYREVLYFFNELYKYQFKINHHCKITADGLKVIVVTFTHDYGGVTSQDIKIKKYANNLYEDIGYINE